MLLIIRIYQKCIDGDTSMTTETGVFIIYTCMYKLIVNGFLPPTTILFMRSVVKYICISGFI